MVKFVHIVKKNGFGSFATEYHKKKVSTRHQNPVHLTLKLSIQYEPTGIRCNNFAGCPEEFVLLSLFQGKLISLLIAP